VQRHHRTNPETGPTQPVAPVVVPDVATEPHPQSVKDVPEDLFAQMLEAAWRAGGCMKPSDIAEELDRAVPGW
jgi:hypothetical protein